MALGSLAIAVGIFAFLFTMLSQHCKQKTNIPTAIAKEPEM